MEPEVSDVITQAEFTKYASGDNVMEDTELQELLNAKFQTGADIANPHDDVIHVVCSHDDVIHVVYPHVRS